MEKLKPVLLLFAVFLSSSLFSSYSCSTSLQFWNAILNNVSLPTHFLIDEDKGALVIAANNSVCHLGFDLTLPDLSNVQTAEPSDGDSFDCLYVDARSEDECQNYHHVLHFPQGPGVINNIPLNETVLTCGSNAFRPRCQYRYRNNLQVINSYSASDFCSRDLTTDTTSLWTSNNRLVAASRSLQNNRFGIRISDSPYTGQVSVATRPNDNFWINRAPDFVSMYEIGEHIYVFFKEEALEVDSDSDKVIYSRVARVCKNDSGTNNPILSSNQDNVFTTFIKARISCSSGSGIAFHYNNIQDTFYLQSSSYDGSNTANVRHLYAVFTSAENGPVGSAVCVYSFNSDSNNLVTVFRGNYKKRDPLDGTLSVQENYDDFSCQANSRSVEDARDIQLMESTVSQSNGPLPLLELPGYIFRKIVVDQVVDVSGTRHEVMFVTAHKEDELYLIKAAYSTTNSGQNYHVISTTLLGSDTEVTQMTLLGSGVGAYVYIGTENGIYQISTADCGRLTDCCSCVSMRDPYCTFDLHTLTCVAVGSTNSSKVELIQDFAGGNSSLCIAITTSADSTSSATSTSNGGGCGTTVVETTVTTATESGDVSLTTVSNISVLGPTGGLDQNLNSTKVASDKHTGTIVGAVCGFIVGVVIGIILMAFFHQRGSFFARKKNLHRRRSQLYDYDSGENASRRKDLPTSSRRKSNEVSGKSGTPDYYKKEEEFMKNNHELSCSGSHATKPNDYTNMPPLANGGAAAAKFVRNHVPSTIAVGATGGQGVNSGAKFTKNPVGSKSAAVVGGAAVVGTPPTVPMETHKTKSASALWATTSYDRGMTSVHRSNPNLKSNVKLEESLTNHDRETYGRNILARQPSVDTTNKLVSSNSRTRVHPAVLEVSYDRHREFVSLADVPRTCSQC